MPACKKFEAQTIDYLFGELDQPQAAVFEQHLSTCTSCRVQVNGFQRVLHLADEAEGALIPRTFAAHDLEMKLYKRLAATQPETPPLWARFWTHCTNVLSMFRVPKTAAICFLIIATICATILVSNPFRATTTLRLGQTDSAAARMEQYRLQDIQRSMEDVLRTRHLRNADEWETVSQLQRVKEQAQGTDWAKIANKHLQSVQLELLNTENP